ncbi:hypothetical protein L3Q82_005902 [Scortum barcoo]|uniref:Uncharacterized protein n=1 Tax=Scortum barcoo TaxID=214431 RepID=A0ACB8V7Y6_9TELE|nr:hypothetical protein L3Q82_005902 [Scortum barcoo]
MLLSSNHHETILLHILHSPHLPLILVYPWLQIITLMMGAILGCGSSCHQVFSKAKATSLPPHRPYDCAIDLQPDTTPPWSHLYCLSASEREAMEAYINDSLAAGLILPSSSLAGQNPCVDYREDELEISPYDDTLKDTRMASLVAASSFMQLDGENQCLKAAQDCGLYEKCGSLRSEYVLACTKRKSGNNRCNQHKCRRALRRFLERVPEEYSLGVLFCPCTNALCGERRRKTIVPSCSYEEMEDQQPNCLDQQSRCRQDDICRSRLADFLNNCQPGPLTVSGCMKDSTGLCLRAYAGLIVRTSTMVPSEKKIVAAYESGTTMTPNYISNSSADVSLRCNCENTGNQWQDCLRLQRMFTHNTCLRNSISWMGSPGSLPADITPPLAPRPSPLVQEDELLSNNHLPEHNNIDPEILEAGPLPPTRRGHATLFQSRTMASDLEVLILIPAASHSAANRFQHMLKVLA